MISDRSMRGTRLGSQSLENEHSIIPAARRNVLYNCPRGHDVIVPLALGAEPPALWECRCGEMALREHAERPEPAPTKPTRTHWDMLLERRTVGELEVLLAERLELLRSKQAAPHRRTA